MKCNNPITIAHYNNGKSTIEGSQSVMIPRIKKYDLEKSINGYYEHINCDGNVEISIFSEVPDMGSDTGEINFEFRCNKCGVSHNLDYSIEDIENMINKII